MSNMFAAPAPPGEGIQWKNYLGALLLIEPKSFEPGIKTAFGENDAVRADVTILDGPNPGEEHLDTLIFPRLLVSQTKTKLGEMVLGRLTQGEQKPGQSPPWLLAEATEQDYQVGASYVQQRQGGQFSQPAPAAQQQPAQQGQQAPAQQWGQPPAAAQGQPQQQGASVPF